MIVPCEDAETKGGEEKIREVIVMCLRVGVWSSNLTNGGRSRGGYEMMHVKTTTLDDKMMWMTHDVGGKQENVKLAILKAIRVYL